MTNNKINELEQRITDLEDLQQLMQKEINDLRAMITGKPLGIRPGVELIPSDD